MSAAPLHRRDRIGRRRNAAWRRRAWPLVLGALLALLPPAAGADDDDPIPPPFDPAPGFEGILPRPVLPPGWVIDQSTVPYGIRQVFNTPEVRLGQSFTPTQAAIDWVGFVFQNSTQPSTVPGPGALRVALYASLTGSSGVLGGLLGETDDASIPSDTTAWLLFRFPETVPLVPGERYWLRVEQVDGHPSWVGGRLQDFYAGGSAFGYLANQDLDWEGYDFAFAEGVIVPEADAGAAAGAALAALAALRSGKRSSPRALSRCASRRSGPPAPA